jgi:delta 1-pyrroline-5-carboxylate dehydrogenase
MPFHPFILGRIFEPELLFEMSAAYEAVCVDLGLAATDDPKTRAVARKIIEFVERGARHTIEMHAMAMMELEMGTPSSAY